MKCQHGFDLCPPCDVPAGAAAMMDRPKTHASGRAMDWRAIDGAAVLLPFYTSGERVEIVSAAWGTVRGVVSRTTGWAPCYLLMRRKGDHGSHITLYGKEVKSVRTVREINAERRRARRA